MVRVSHSLQSLRKCVRTHYECVFLVIDTVRSCYDDDFLLLIKAQKWQIKGEKNNNNNKHIEMRMVPHGSNFVIGILLCVPHFNVVFFVRACSADTHTHTHSTSQQPRGATAFISFRILSAGAISHSVVVVLLVSLRHPTANMRERSPHEHRTGHSHSHARHTNTNATVSERRHPWQNPIPIQYRREWRLSMFWRLLIKIK